MGSKWRKAKLALGCIHVPSTMEDSTSSVSPPNDVAHRFSDPTSLSPTHSRLASLPMTPTPSSSGLRLPKHSTKSSKMTCAICLNTMARGDGHAIFTAECSHSFHFNCITSNVKHGNRICPVCRAKWKEIPFQGHTTDLLHRKSRINSVDDALMSAFRQLHPPRSNRHQNTSAILQAPEPAVFDDDELLPQLPESAETSASTQLSSDKRSIGTLEIRTYPEVAAVSNSASYDDFTVLIHLEAPPTRVRKDSESSETNFPLGSQNPRAPVDLVTVLDVSGSMAGTKLAMLKRAMGFVIQNLSPHDRLSVIAFSSTAQRLFPLRRMTDTGRSQALQAVNSLAPNGGTNIADGLKKGAKVMVERKWKNPVGSIILLSDGQDTYTVNSPAAGAPSQSGYRSVLPASLQGFHIPVHTFGFGIDHDAASMHSISETSGGTFSFIEAEAVIQDAFAQCIGGLLSVVVQELQLRVECVCPGLQLGSIKSGSYKYHLAPDARIGDIDVGDLYAEEERDFLVMLNVPTADKSINEMSLLKVRYSYRDPITKEEVILNEAGEIKIHRPQTAVQPFLSIEVDRQRNRLKAAEAMSEARAAAERGNLAAAVSILKNCRKALSETISAQAGDGLCVALDAELKEMQERMANRQVYETSGRAYVLSGLSSHSWQRATARGDSMDSTSLVQAYQTSFMVDMVSRSQTMVLGSPSSHLPRRPPWSFPRQPNPR
ncbi:hypothetical protein Ancab_008282 [Ancistrocladus abbreviatus]